MFTDDPAERMPARATTRLGLLLLAAVLASLSVASPASAKPKARSCASIQGETLAERTIPGAGGSRAVRYFTKVTRLTGLYDSHARQRVWFGCWERPGKTAVVHDLLAELPSARADHGPVFIAKNGAIVTQTGEAVQVWSEAGESLADAGELNAVGVPLLPLVANEEAAFAFRRDTYISVIDARGENVVTRNLASTDFAAGERRFYWTEPDGPRSFLGLGTARATDDCCGGGDAHAGRLGRQGTRASIRGHARSLRLRHGAANAGVDPKRTTSRRSCAAAPGVLKARRVIDRGGKPSRLRLLLAGAASQRIVLCRDTPGGSVRSVLAENIADGVTRSGREAAGAIGADGSVVVLGANVSDTDPPQNVWTVYAPDGRRTASLRTQVAEAGPQRLLATDRGGFAFVDAQGSLHAVDAAGERVLSAGPVTDPAAAGTHVYWTEGDATRSAALNGLARFQTPGTES